MALYAFDGTWNEEKDSGVYGLNTNVVRKWLAGRGLKVANVPLVKGIDPPGELFQLDPARVAGFHFYRVLAKGCRPFES